MKNTLQIYEFFWEKQYNSQVKLKDLTTIKCACQNNFVFLQNHYRKENIIS